ncbi:uncharacterized protein CIMG_13681 [Coccidioides immitis RS]|uniref:Uncharacterized protein n=1 Tax=Coccidioides immitis (strain RS) TaxID=246410 RepID=A0A0D8JVU4_COCIM|nr:uncharacterized protein CIMG_13681 [Coccidioides immitis RS]KJF61450.1 hypothetical protein CIMG_13681 [Coccidioides immitis RS]
MDRKKGPVACYLCPHSLKKKLWHSHHLIPTQRMFYLSSSAFKYVVRSLLKLLAVALSYGAVSQLSGHAILATGAETQSDESLCPSPATVLANGDRKVESRTSPRILVVV